MTAQWWATGFEYRGRRKAQRFDTSSLRNVRYDIADVLDTPS